MYQSPLRQRQQLAKDSLEALVSVPNTVSVGEIVEGSFTITAERLGGPGSPDHCIPSQLIFNGKSLDVSVFANGARQRRTNFCVPEGGERTGSFSFQASSVGEVTVRVEARGASSNTLYASTEQTVTIQESTNGGGVTPINGGGNGGNGGGGGLFDGILPGGGGSGAAGLVLVVLFLIAAINLGG